jgi:hypothetical protein
LWQKYDGRAAGDGWADTGSKAMMDPTLGNEATIWLRKLKDAAFSKVQPPAVPSRPAKELRKTGYAEEQGDGSLRISEFGYQYLRMLDRHDCT